MSNPDDQTFYSRRIAEEMERGDRAIDAAIAAIHYELAHRYSILAASAGRGTAAVTVVNGAKEHLAA